MDKGTPECEVRWVIGRWLLTSVMLSSVLVSTPAIATDESAAELHFQRASKLAEQGNANEAEHEYLLGLNLAASPEAYNNLGVIYFKRQNFPRAAFAFKQAHSLRPEDSEISFNLGLALYKTGNSAAAIPHLSAGTASKNHAADAHYLLGACYYELSLNWPGSNNPTVLRFCSCSSEPTEWAANRRNRSRLLPSFSNAIRMLRSFTKPSGRLMTW